MGYKRSWKYDYGSIGRLTGETRRQVSIGLRGHGYEAGDLGDVVRYVMLRRWGLRPEALDGGVASRIQGIVCDLGELFE